MSVDRVLQLKLMGDVSGINNAVTGVSGKIRALGATVKGFGIALAADLAIESVDKLGEAIGNAWTGFREGEQAVGRLETVWNNLDLDAGDLGPVVDAIGDMAKAVGQDDVAALDAFNAALLRTGDQDAAMRDLAIAMDLVAAGKATDLAGAMTIIKQASEGSARAVVTFGLDAETAGGRIEQLGALVEGAAAKAAALDPLGTAFNALQEDLEGFVGAFAAGDVDGMLEAVRTAMSDLGAVLDTVGPKLTEWLDKLTGGAWSDFAAALGEAWATVQPTLQGIEVAIHSVFNMLSNTVELIKGVIEGDWQKVWDSAEAILKAPFDAIGGIIGGFIGTIRRMMGDAIDAIVDPIRGALNSVIHMWNSLGIHIPEIVLFEGFGRRDTFGPIDIAFPDIPTLAKGGVVKRATLALMGEAGPEAVVPLDRMGGIGGNTYHITVNVAPGTDPAEVGRQLVRAIQSYERIAGPGWRAA